MTDDPQPQHPAPPAEPSPGDGAGARSEGDRTRPPIELGWVLVGRLPTTDREAAETARERMQETLDDAFPGYDWRIPVVEREGPGGGAETGRVEPVQLLDLGVRERQAKGWDFALVITGADLACFEKPFALGTPSRSLSVAVASTARIDPRASGRGRSDGERAEIMAHRLQALVLHLFGHLNELGHSEDPESWMFDLGTVTDLDRMRRFSSGNVDELGRELEEVADLRLEEERGAGRQGRVRFYLRVLRHNRDDILDSVRRSRPWQFPLRFSRLTAAAFSALLILMMTAEAWDLGMSQDPLLVAVLSAVILVGGSGYLLRRQGLLVRREVPRLTELAVVGNVSTVISVVFGMLTTYAALFGVTLLLGRTLYRPRLVTAWATSVESVGWSHYLVLAGFVACLGLLIGALGASFEGQSYFRHVAWVDEET